MAVADVYDALISRRPYKQPIGHETSVEMIVAARGTHFDPDIVDAFIEIQDEFFEISRKYEDADEDIQEKARRVEEVMSLQTRF